MCRAAIIQILPQHQINCMVKDDKRKADALEEKQAKKRNKNGVEEEEEQEQE